MLLNPSKQHGNDVPCASSVECSSIYSWDTEWYYHFFKTTSTCCLKLVRILAMELLCCSAMKCNTMIAKVHSYMGGSKNYGTPKSSSLIRFSIINRPFWGTIIFGNTHMQNCMAMKTNTYTHSLDLGYVF